MMALSFVVRILLCETIAMASLKEFSQTTRYRFLALGLLFYGVVAFFAVRVYEFENLSVVNAVWSASSVLAVVTVGAVMFHESITRRTAVGIMITVAGIVMLRLQ